MSRIRAFLLLALLGIILYSVRHELRSAAGLDARALAGGALVVGAVPRILPASDQIAASDVPTAAHEAKIENVFQTNGGLMVMLKLTTGNVDGKRFLPIFVGTGEALAIAREMARPRVVPPRPMTHDLLRNAITLLAAKVDRVTVTRIDDGTFYAVISLRRNGKTIYMDARPSDSMALALRTRAKIFVADEVMRQAGQRNVRPPEGEQDEPEPEDAADEPVGEEPLDSRERQLRLQRKGFI